MMKNWKQDCYGVVYQITNTINGKYYIGQTIDFKKRMTDHRRAKKDTHFYNAIKKYGWDKFDVWILYKCNNQEDLNFFESILMPECLVNNENVYNEMAGGGSRGSPSLTTRKKLSEAHKGLKAGEKNPMFGRTGAKSPRFGLTGERCPRFGITGGKHHRARPVIATCLTTGVEMYYKYAKEAEEINNKFIHQCIAACCRGLRKTHAGYIWRYA